MPPDDDDDTGTNTAAPAARAERISALRTRAEREGRALRAEHRVLHDLVNIPPLPSV